MDKTVYAVQIFITGLEKTIQLSQTVFPVGNSYQQFISQVEQLPAFNCFSYLLDYFLRMTDPHLRKSE
ncbi:MAG: hypothetical protein R6V77_05500 [Candidatus Cloacimonadaceae bacterium]